METLIGGIDAGGTTFKCGLATVDGDILERAVVSTSTPETTIKGCAEFLKSAAERRGNSIKALGVAAFGPLDIDPNSPTFGTIQKTPKPGWSMVPLKSRFERALNVPVAIDTDVNAALRAEMSSGAARHCFDAAYITVGTGIGAGICLGGQFAGAPTHPELGHILVKRHAEDLDFNGVCPFHGDCLEGLASAYAFETRYGDPRTLSLDHIGWRIEAYYLAQACINLVMFGRLKKIVLGGGLMRAEHLLPLVKTEFHSLNADYLPIDEGMVDELIQRSGHGDEAGLVGALCLARGVKLR